MFNPEIISQPIPKRDIEFKEKGRENLGPVYFELMKERSAIIWVISR